MTAATHSGLADRMYARLGWKVWVALGVGTWLFAYVLILLSLANVARQRPIAGDALFAAFVGETLITLVSAVFTVILGVRQCRPLRGPLVSQEELLTAWQTAVSLPIRLTLTGGFVVTAWTVPTSLAVYARTFGLDLPLLIYFAVGGVVISTSALSAVLYVAPVLARPQLADLQTRLDTVPTAHTVTLRTRFMLLIPAFSLGATAAGALFAQPNGSGIDASNSAIVVAASLIGLVMWTPIALILTRSMLDPLAELIAAAERIKHGDYTQPAPEAWADELGTLANSLNEAMRGLTERQQMAREVRESRARIVAAGDESRRRIERNIHDGAQQRLVALVLDIRMLESSAASMTADELATAHRQLADSVKDALGELRDLARGLHPAVLTTDGLQPALRQLTTRATVPVDLLAPDKRFAEQVETTGYFVVAEALANVGKYANATRATVTIAETDGTVQFSIVDDGIGGAAATLGSGLAGLADRVAAIGGRLIVDSPVGMGTKIVAELPVSGV